MKLAHVDFENTFCVLPGRVNVLVVESEEQFCAYCRELYAQTEGDCGNFCLSENEETLPLSKHALLVSDFFSLQVNDKKFSAKLYRSLQQIGERYFLQEYQRLCTLWAEFFAKLNAESDCPLSYEEDCGMESLFKAFNVHIEQEETLLEELLLYIRVHVAFLKTRCFFFVNLKTVLPEPMLCALYREAELNGFCLFLLENTPRTKLDGEVVTIIDRDLCEIVA